jgi:hypothetical protein
MRWQAKGSRAKNDWTTALVRHTISPSFLLQPGADGARWLHTRGKSVTPSHICGDHDLQPYTGAAVHSGTTYHPYTGQAATHTTAYRR